MAAARDGIACDDGGLATHPYLEHGGPLAFAHRGGHDVAPENTMASFRHAWSLGYRYLETDAHLTADGVLVAFHDPDLTRTCGIDANIAEMTVDEVTAARVVEPDGPGQPIPLLSELFEEFPAARFNIDAKSDDSVEPLAAMVEAFGALDRVCLASFKLDRLRRLRSLLGPELLTNISPSGITMLRTVGRLRDRSPRAAQVPTTMNGITIVNRRFLTHARRLGVPVHVWTINERPEMERLLDLGVDGIMTDETAMLRDVLVARGAWAPER